MPQNNTDSPGHNTSSIVVRPRMPLFNQPRPALASEIIPDPLRGDDHPVLESNQQHDVDDAPHQPGEPAGQAPPAEIEYRGVPSDDGGVAAIVEAERPPPPAPREAAPPAPPPLPAFPPRPPHP